MILSDYAIKFRVTVFALTVVLLIAGPLVYLALPREGAPDITIPYVFVTAAYEGVAPAEVENLITIPLEKRLNDLENIKEMSSTSSEGVSMIAIEFTPQQDIDDAIQKVKDKVDMAKPDLPDDLDQPSVQGLNLNTDVPILNFAISGSPDLDRLKNIAEDVQDAVETVPGVLQARLFGAPEREIRIEVDITRLTAYSLTLGDVMSAVRRENSTISAGNLELSGDKFQVRIPGEFTTVEPLRDLVIRSSGDRPVRLTDVAAISDTYKDLTSVSRIDGHPCVSVAVHKRSGENTDGLIRQVKKVLAAQPLPPGIRLTIVNDESEIIRMMIEDLENNIASGFLFVFVILLLFLGWRNSLLVGMAIPLSMMIGFVVLAALGITLNMIVLFSLVLAVGMLVDNAIVLVENTYRHHCEGESRMDAARRGASEVAWPVINSTLTTLAAFAPMLYWPGIMGQFMRFLPETVIITLTASLFVAMVMNPAICSVFIHRPRHPESIDEPGPWLRFMNAYERLLRGALAHPWLCLFIGGAFLALSVAAFGRYSLGVELFPETQPRRATIEVRYPEGTDIHTTDAALRRIERGLTNYPDIRVFLSTAGAGAQQLMSSGGGTHLGNIALEFPPFAERTTNTLELVGAIRAGIGSFPGAQVKVEREKEGPPTGWPVSIEVSGEDFGTLGEIADEITRAIRDVPGLVDLQDSMEDARPELQFRVDRERAALLGLDTDTIGRFLRTAVNGDTASKYRAGEDEYDITVRLRGDQRRSVDLLKQMSITTPAGQPVPLASLGTFGYEGGRGQIQRKDQKRVITIGGNSQGRGVDRILADVRARVAKLTLPRGYTVRYTGDTKDMDEASAFLSKAFIIALALISLILIMEFNSITQPVLILISVILSLIGVLWGLLGCHMRFGVIMTGIGVVSLAGVVVNNGIVLIDCINQRKRGGMSSLEAIVTGGRLRLRPVLLTAISTVIGLVPMAIGWSLEVHSWPPRIVASTETSDWWAPMAVAVIFGLSLATVLTLVQVPVMYRLADSLSERISRRFGRDDGESARPS